MNSIDRVTVIFFLVLCFSGMGGLNVYPVCQVRPKGMSPRTIPRNRTRGLKRVANTWFFVGFLGWGFFDA